MANRIRSSARGVRAGASALLWLLLLSIAAERELNAYTDPGTGALVWQMVAAGFVGLLFYFRKLARFLRKKGQD